MENERDFERNYDSEKDSAYIYLDRGCWHVSMSVDDDYHLTIFVSNDDRTKVHEINEDLGDEWEWAARFTTDAIEDEYNYLMTEKEG